MDHKAILLTLTSVAIFTGCGLYEGIPSYVPLRPDCDAPCGPCSLGRYSCDLDECTFGIAQSEEVTCSEDVLFVSENADEGNGTKSSPFSSLDKAIAAATSNQDIRAIIIAGSPDINGPVKILDGVSIYGGYEPESWDPSTSQRPSIITTQAQSDELMVGIRVEQLLRPTSLNRIRVQSGPHPDGPVAGILARTALSLTLNSVIITALNAGDGQMGTSGMKGASGVDALNQPVETIQIRCEGANGGRGGFGNGKGGDSEGGAKGGEPMLNGRFGMSGQTGMTGGTGKGWTFVEGRWREATQGTQGETGGPGQGGGGGGGGDGISGGSGGSGGCGGEGGLSGLGGWTSTGILNDSSNIVIINETVIQSGNGGDGGLGGIGGEGGKGGRGAPGIDSAGNGGTGGDGGIGGTGGSGTPGSSYGIYCAKPVEIRVDGTNTIAAGAGGSNTNGELGKSEPISDSCTLRP